MPDCGITPVPRKRIRQFTLYGHRMPRSSQSGCMERVFETNNSEFISDRTYRRDKFPRQAHRLERVQLLTPYFVTGQRGSAYRKVLPEQVYARIPRQFISAAILSSMSVKIRQIRSRHYIGGLLGNRTYSAKAG